MRRVRAPVLDLAPGERALDEHGARYVARVLRLREGDAFVAFDPRAHVEADAVIARIDGSEVLVRIGAPRAGEKVARLEVAWVQGLAKGEKVDAIVRDATELGATRIVAASTARAVVKVAGDRGDAKRARWDRIAREAARQSGRADAPVIEGPLAWADALDAAARALPEDAARFALWESATTPLAPALARALGDGRALAFAVGPEGGLAEDEARLAESRGWSLMSLGPIILRVETVAAAVLGAVRVWSDAFAQPGGAAFPPRAP
jgi:16S rRNA (uracil1498-N3)-methyltransferase